MVVSRVIQRINERIIHGGLHDKNGKLYNDKCSIKVRIAKVQDVDLCSLHIYRVLETCQCDKVYFSMTLTTDGDTHG